MPCNAFGNVFSDKLFLAMRHVGKKCRKSIGFMKGLKKWLRRNSQKS